MENNQEVVTKKIKEPSPFWSRQFIFIFVIAFLIYMSSTMLSQTLPKYANDLGATAQAVGLLAGIFQICALALRPVSGQIVDNENRLIMLRVVLCVILVSVTGFVVSKNYWMLVAFRAIHGFSWGVGSTLCMTIATSCFSSKNMTTGIGIYGLGQTLAQTVAPTFALPIAYKLGYNTLYIGNFALITICLVITLFMKVESPKPKVRKYSYNIKKMIYLPAILPATMTMCNNIAKSSIQAFLVIFAGTMGMVNIGIYFTIQAATIFIARPILSKLADKYGLLKMLIPCEICEIIALVIISFSYNLPTFLVASVIYGIGIAGEQPILMSECVKSAPPEKRGNASNTSYVGTDIGGFIGSNLAGVIVASFGYRNMYRVFTIPLIVFITAYTILYKKRQNSRHISEAQSKVAY